MRRSTTHERTVARLTTRFEQVHALLVFARCYDAVQRREYESARATVGGLTKRALDAVTARVDEEIDRLVRLLKPSQPLQFYVQFLSGAEIGDGQLIFVPKWQLKQFFGGIEDVLRGLDLHPEHTLVSFDLHGIYPPGTRGEVRILEAALFEDMCALFNRALELSPQALRREAPRRIIKECAATRRGAVLAAFYLVEAYLNSLAFDYLVAHAREGPNDDLDKIAEWDHRRGRERLVAFRDKLLSYPRIILGLDHPPIQESNCPEMRFLLEESKLFRDAIVHANPRPDPLKRYSSKELAFWCIGSVTPIRFRKDASTASGANTAEDWERTIDSAIALIERIETVVHGHTKRLFWLQRRTALGAFADSVFD